MTKYTFTAYLEKTEGALWGCYVVVPRDIAECFTKEAGSKRVVCEINEKVTLQCALMKNKVSYFINISKEVRKQAGRLDIGDEVRLVLSKDESKYGLPMPEEFKELLNQDPEGDAIFHKLTPGKQRSLLHIIGSPKTSVTRLKKAVVVLDYLKDTNGQLDFKELNAAFKDVNERIK